MSLKRYWTPTGGHTELGTSAPKEAFTTIPTKRHLQHRTRQLYSTLLAWQVVLASLTLSQYYRQGGKDNICFPPWHSHSVLGYGHPGQCSCTPSPLPSAALNNWSTYTSHGRTCFPKSLGTGFEISVAHTGNGARAVPLLHTMTLGFCVSSSSSLISNIHTKQAPNTTFKEVHLSKHLPGRWRSTPPI